jgi:transposase
MYGDEMRRAAVKWYADGAGYRQIARHFGVDHVTVMNWVKAHPCQVKRRCTSSKWTSYSPLWARKKQAYLVTLVERRTSCIVGWCVTSERDQVTLQSLLDASPPAVWYYSDLFATYKTLLYTPGVHTAMPDKS